VVFDQFVISWWLVSIASNPDSIVPKQAIVGSADPDGCLVVLDHDGGNRPGAFGMELAVIVQLSAPLNLKSLQTEAKPNAAVFRSGQA